MCKKVEIEDLTKGQCITIILINSDLNTGMFVGTDSYTGTFVGTDGDGDNEKIILQSLNKKRTKRIKVTQIALTLLNP